MSYQAVTPVRTLRLDDALAATHTLRRVVSAYPIFETHEIASDRRITVLVDGEPMHAEVPADFCASGTPVTGDWLIVSRLGEISHMRDDVFRGESLPVPRVPRFPG